jgi:predicted glycosyltransferase involved in capsule biosynthesis
LLEFQDISLIEKRLNDIEYNGSFQLVSDLRQLLLKNGKYLSQDFETTKQVRDFKDAFELLAKEIENLPLKDFNINKNSTDSSSNKDLKRGTSMDPVLKGMERMPSQ